MQLWFCTVRVLCSLGSVHLGFCTAWVLYSLGSVQIWVCTAWILCSYGSLHLRFCGTVWILWSVQSSDFILCFSCSKTTGADPAIKNHRQQWHRVTKETQCFSPIPLGVQERNGCAGNQKVGYVKDSPDFSKHFFGGLQGVPLSHKMLVVSSELRLWCSNSVFLCFRVKVLPVKSQLKQ